MTELKGPDGYGFYYCDRFNARKACQINLMPPLGGKYGTPDDPILWIAYAGGEEVGRYTSKAEALEAAEVAAARQLK